MACRAAISTSCSTLRCCKRSSEMLCTISTISVCSTDFSSGRGLGTSMISSTARCKIRSWSENVAISISCWVSFGTGLPWSVLKSFQKTSPLQSTSPPQRFLPSSQVAPRSPRRCIGGCPPEETHAQLQRSPSWLAKLARRQTALLCAWKGATEERPWFHRRFSVSICCTGRSTVWSSMRTELRSRRNVMIPPRICVPRSASTRSWWKISTTSMLVSIVRGEGAVMCGTAHRRVVRSSKLEVRSSKFEVRSSKSEVWSRTSESRLSLLSFPPPPLSHIPARPRTWGRRKTEKGCEGRVWDQIDFLLLESSYFLRNPISSFIFRASTSSTDFRHWKLVTSPVFSSLSPSWCFFLFVFFSFSVTKTEEVILELRTSERSWTLHVMTLRLRIVDESLHDVRSRQSSSTDMDVSKESISFPSGSTWETPDQYAISNIKTVMKVVFLYDHVQTTIFFCRGRHILNLTSWPDELVLETCKQEITCSWSFYPVPNHIENWIKGKKRFSSASGHMCLLEWRLRHNVRPHSSLSYKWVRTWWLRERVDSHLTYPWQ